MYQPNKAFEPDAPAILEPWRKALLDAAEYIRVHGWCQGDMQDGAGRVCAVGAVHAAGGAERDVLKFYSYMRNHGYGGGVMMWNDTPGRTADEVVNALQAAARS